jgi:hypothetical protein
MAFKAVIAGVDKTSSLLASNSQQVSITKQLNQQATATFVTKPGYVPSLFDDVKLYETDGTTLKFGGVVLGRSTNGFQVKGNPYSTSVSCGDYFSYLDWSIITLAYTTTKTLKQVLTDIVALLPATYGITLDAGQVTGPTLQPFNWTQKKASDAVRELSTTTGYVAVISPAKALSMFVPGTSSAPNTITDAAPHCMTFDYADPTSLPANDCFAICGPTGPAVVTQAWTVGAPSTWQVDIQCVQGGWNQGYVTESVGPVNRTVSPPGGGGYYYFDQTVGRGTLSVGTGSKAANGTVLTFNYTASFPFTAEATSGATPVIQLAQTYPSVTDYSQGVAIAAGMLSANNQTPRTATVTTNENGWDIGQALAVNLTARLNSNFVITNVTYVLQITKSGPMWVGSFQAIESTVYQGGYLDQWRALLGNTSGTGTLTSIVSGGGGSSIGGSGIAGEIAYWTSATNLSGYLQVPAAAGGTNLDTHASSGVPSINAGTWSINNVLTAGQLLYGAASNAITSSSSLSFSGSTLTLNNTITTPSSTNLVLSPTSNLVTNTVNVLPNTGYTTNIGALTNKYLALYAGELWVETLVAQNTIATIGGRVLVAPTNLLTADLASGATTGQFKYNNLANGDFIYFEANGNVEFIKVTSSASGSAGAYTYTLSRNQDGSGANNWSSGDACIDTGSASNTGGYIDLYSVAGVLSGTHGPTIVGNVRTGTTWNNIANRWAIGNLDGIYSYSGTTWGAAFGDPSGAWIKIDTTNGVRLGYNTTTKVQIDTSGNASLASGTVTIDTTGLHVTVGSGISSNNAYSFSGSGFTGTELCAMYGYESGSLRQLYLYNSIGQSGKVATTSLYAAGATVAASVNVAADETGGVGTPGTSITLNATNVMPGAADSCYLGGANQAWKALYLYTQDVGLLFAGLGTTYASLTNDTGNRMVMACGSTRYFWDISTGFNAYFPEADGTVNLGLAAHRWGTVYAATALINTSDGRQKKNVRDTSFGADFLMHLRAVDFEWVDKNIGVKQGFIAQDIAQVSPMFGGLHYGDDGVADGLNYSSFIPALVKGFQEHEVRLRALEATQST